MTRAQKQETDQYTALCDNTRAENDCGDGETSPSFFCIDSEGPSRVTEDYVLEYEYVPKAPKVL